MLDRTLRRWIDPLLSYLARPFARIGFTPNAMTVFGFLLGIAGCFAIAKEQYYLGLAMIALNRLADGLDGMLARHVGVTDIGGYLDIVLDMLFYSAVPLAFGMAQPINLLPAICLIYSFVGTGGSFLAYAAIAAKRGITPAQEENKSFYYAVGLMEGGETILFFVLFCLFPGHFPLLAWIFTALCALTTLARIAMAIRVFRDLPR